MSDIVSKSLFFIKSPGSNISAIELYLKKRGFQVYSESDLKLSVIEAMKTNPDYIFLAWDHPNERIHNLPKIILQSMLTTMVSYCTSNEKTQIRKLQSSGQNHKLFPPLSGPAIQRLILTLEKENTQIESGQTSQKKNENPILRQNQNTHIKSVDKKNELDQLLSVLDSTTASTPEIYIDKGHRAQLLRNKQSVLTQTNVMYLSPVQEIVSSVEHKMTEPLKNKLNTRFIDQVQKPIEEMFETLIESQIVDAPASRKNQTLQNARFGFCVIIESLNWNGYLIVASEAVVDLTSLESILISWINENLETDTIDQNIVTAGFEIDLNDITFENFSEQFADYTKSIVVNDQKTVLSFLSISPELMTLRIHDTQDMIEILTAEVPISLPVPFDLYLHLPENKKFILYCKKDSLVATMQIDRLIEKKIKTLYSPLDFDQKVQQFRAEYRIRTLIEKFKDNQKK